MQSHPFESNQQFRSKGEVALQGNSSKLCKGVEWILEIREGGGYVTQTIFIRLGRFDHEGQPGHPLWWRYRHFCDVSGAFVRDVMVT